MMNQYFGELEYATGWKTKRQIELFGNIYDIVSRFSHTIRKTVFQKNRIRRAVCILKMKKKILNAWKS